MAYKVPKLSNSRDPLEHLTGDTRHRNTRHRVDNKLTVKSRRGKIKFEEWRMTAAVSWLSQHQLFWPCCTVLSRYQLSLETQLFFGSFAKPAASERHQTC